MLSRQTASRPLLVPRRSFAEEATNIRVYKECNKAVVNITSITASEDAFFNVVPHEGTGSGTIINPQGFILTNYHVINGAQAVKVKLYDGSVYAAQLVGEDPTNDLAVIQINAAGKTLSTIPLGDSTNLEVARRVFAIGNPFGFDRTLTTGIISSIGRTIKAETNNGRLIKGIIQTDAAINPGNSGGPLLDSAGHMIGITTAIFSPLGNLNPIGGQSSGIGFAIPINTAKRVIPELIAHHQISRPDIGVLVQATERGLRIIKLDPIGAGAKAGLNGPQMVEFRDGPFLLQTLDQSLADIITAVDNQPMRSPDDLLSYIEEKKPGQVVTLTILRAGKQLKIPVKLTVVSPA